MVFVNRWRKSNITYAYALTCEIPLKVERITVTAANFALNIYFPFHLKKFSFRKISKIPPWTSSWSKNTGKKKSFANFLAEWRMILHFVVEEFANNNKKKATRVENFFESFAEKFSHSTAEKCKTFHPFVLRLLPASTGSNKKAVFEKFHFRWLWKVSFGVWVRKSGK